MNVERLSLKFTNFPSRSNPHLMGVVGVPLGLHLAGPLGVGQQADRRAEDVGEAVQLALGQVVAAANQR